MPHPPPHPSQNPQQPEQTPDNREIVSVEAAFIGPLPPPSLLRGYEEVSPGAAERIIKMAEDQGVHRRSMESQMAEAAIEDMRLDYREARFGQTCGLIVALAMVAGGVALGFHGSPGWGAALGGGGVGFQVVGLFLRGRERPSEVVKDSVKRGNPKAR